MKKLIFFVVFLLAAYSAGAETVYLKSGVTATGKIVDRSDTSVVIDVGGATVTYYKDEIDRIDDGATPPAAPAAVSAPAAVPLAQDQTVPAVLPKASEPLASSLSAAKRDLILKFIDAFGTRASMKANFEQMMASLAPEEAAKLRTAFNVDDIIEQLLPLYDRYFSEGELKAYIDFYNSDNGKKLVSSIPLIMRGSVEVSAKYFESHMPEEFKKGAAKANGSAGTVPEAGAVK
ncbi:MAG: DUF2059 domain-containing protein [Candidatus Omnitrophica bacterium]|nr:DUF2059 domain-containing protein [Candidatus Omnitrophota bacterium]